MGRRWLRIAVVVVALATLGYTGHRIRLAELTLDAEQNVERVFTDLSWTLTLTLADLRAAQQAYVAEGQDRIYWTSKVNSHLDTVRGSLDNLRRLATNPISIEALDAADGAVAELERIDGRAREHADQEQPLLASDLIFTDGLELAARAATHVELARVTERTTRNDAISAARSSQTAMVTTAAGLTVLALFVLVPMKMTRAAGASPFASAETESEEAGPARELDLPAEGRLMFDELDVNDDGGSATTPAAGVPEPETDTAAADPVPDLRGAADLCTDLCTLADTSELPALLARAAGLMNASGLIIWVRDSSGHALRPAIGHGYSRRALEQLGAIAEEGNNATAAAYRSACLQVVESDAAISGAVAAPLMAADSCVGVLSLELRDRWESSAAVQATATIMAAQLATLLSADPPADAAAPPAEAHA